MDSDREPLFAGIKDETSRLKADFAELLRVRWQLGKLEAQTAVHSIRRLAIAAAIAGLLALIALPVLVVALANVLDGALGISFAGWLAIFGCGMLVAALALAWFRYRRFRAEFAGLEQSLEELREDFIWLEERLARRQHHHNGHAARVSERE
jgi:uncharacterized membrane protein YqjE